jgi:hypothetical protein
VPVCADFNKKLPLPILKAESTSDPGALSAEIGIVPSGAKTKMHDI